jgi:hypothetical protein
MRVLYVGQILESFHGLLLYLCMEPLAVSASILKEEYGCVDGLQHNNGCIACDQAFDCGWVARRFLGEEDVSPQCFLRNGSCTPAFSLAYLQLRLQTVPRVSAFMI